MYIHNECTQGSDSSCSVIKHVLENISYGFVDMQENVLPFWWKISCTEIQFTYIVMLQWRNSFYSYIRKRECRSNAYKIKNLSTLKVGCYGPQL